MCHKCQDVAALINGAGSEYAWVNGLVYLHGQIVAYFRHLSANCHEAGCVGMPAEYSAPGALSLDKLIARLEAIAYGQ